MIAGTIEWRWEAALEELEQARSRLAKPRARTPQSDPIPVELRRAFTNVEQCLPTVWDQLPIEVHKALLRMLVGVNPLRNAEDSCECGSCGEAV